MLNLFFNAEKISGNFDDSNVFMYAYRRRCRGCRRAPFQTASRSLRYFRAISRQLTRLRDHTWASSGTWYYFRRITSFTWNSFRDSGFSYDFCDPQVNFVSGATADRSFRISVAAYSIHVKRRNRDNTTRN